LWIYTSKSSNGSVSGTYPFFRRLDVGNAENHRGWMSQNGIIGNAVMAQTRRRKMVHAILA
jgi:hypothetical protein